MTELSNIIKNITAVLTVAAFASVPFECFAQRYPERRYTRQGNKAYEKADYAGSEVKYRKALTENNALYEANFNVGDAVYKQQRYDEAVKIFTRTAADTTCTDDNRAASLFNKGNALFKQRKFEEAAEAYKESLRIKPDDKDCKFNLAYAQKMIAEQKGGNNQNQNQQNQQQQNQQQKDQNKDQNQNKDQQNQQNKDNGQNKQNPKDNQNGQGQQGDQPQQQGEKPQPQGGPQGEPRISKQEADQLLQAIQGEEDKTRDKVEKARAVSVGRSGKNW